MEKQQNSQFWKEIEKHPEKVQKAFWYGAEDLGKFLGDDPKLYSSYLNYKSDKPDPNWPWYKKAIFYYSQSQTNEYVTKHNVVVAIKENSSWLGGMLQGDFNKNPTLSQIIVGGMISLIPVVDQVCDIRDLIANLITLSDEKERTSENYMALALTSVGLIPEIGSIVKTTIKAVKTKGVTKLSLMKTMESLESNAVKLGAHCPWGRAPETWLRSEPWKGVASKAYIHLQKNINRLQDTLRPLLTHGTGLFQARIKTFFTSLMSSINAVEKYIKDLCTDVSKRINELMPQPHLAMAGHSSSSGRPINTPINRYDTNTAGSTPTQVTHQQKEVKPEKDKSKEKTKDDTCILRPYKPDTCKPKGKTGHHVVPDRCFRLGKRVGLDRHQIDGALSEADGLVICVEGATPQRDNEHGKIHELHTKLEKQLQSVLKPEGSGYLIEVEVICAQSVVKVLKKCSGKLIFEQLRTYHQSKGLGPKFIVRLDSRGSKVRKLDPNLFGGKTQKRDF